MTEDQKTEEPRDPIATQVALYDRITLAVETGDQAWRKDVRDRWVKHMEKRADAEQARADKLREEGHAESADQAQVNADELKRQAERTRNGDMGMNDEAAEIAMRVAAESGT